MNLIGGRSDEPNPPPPPRGYRWVHSGGSWYLLREDVAITAGAPIDLDGLGTTVTQQEAAADMIVNRFHDQLEEEQRRHMENLGVSSLPPAGDTYARAIAYFPPVASRSTGPADWLDGSFFSQPMADWSTLRLVKYLHDIKRREAEERQRQAQPFDECRALAEGIASGTIQRRFG